MQFFEKIPSLISLLKKVKISDISVRDKLFIKMEKNSIRLNALTDQLNKDLRKSEEYGDQLRETLNKHDLTHLANKKPGLIEKRMQNATDKLWGDLESVTSDNTTD